MSAKNDVPGAKTIYEDLRKRFEAQNHKTEEENTDSQ
jgi:hypothetical protein